MKKLAALLILALPAVAGGTPSITSSSGTATTNSTMTFNGAGYDTKQRSKPWVYADFQNGSINPDPNLSYNTAWASTQNKTTTSTGVRWGTKTSSTSWTTSTNTSEFGIPVMTGLANGATVYQSFYRYSTVNYATNWKWDRCYKDAPGNKPNWYIGDSVSSDLDGRPVYVEDLTPVNGETRKYYSNYTNPGAAWRHEEFITRMNSGTGVIDGRIDIRLDSVSLGSDNSFQYNSSARPGLENACFIQDTKSGTLSASEAASYVLIDSIYVDDSLNRVEVCDASTWAAVTHCEIQPYTSWTATQVTVVLKLGSLTGSKWVYIHDKNDNVNSNGFALATGGAPAPTVTSVSPSTGTTAGGTSVAITGTDFVNGATVKFGGVAATSVVFNSATSLTATTPAGSAGIVDVVVTNPDTQSSALSDDFFTYVSPPPPPVATSVCPCR